jgi:hypothetical protein
MAAIEPALCVVDSSTFRACRRLLQYRGSRAHLEISPTAFGTSERPRLGREQGDLGTVGVGYSNLATILLSRSAQESADAWPGIDFTKARGMSGNARWLTAEHTWRSKPSAGTRS